MARSLQGCPHILDCSSCSSLYTEDDSGQPLANPLPLRPTSVFLASYSLPLVPTKFGKKHPRFSSPPDGNHEDDTRLSVDCIIIKKAKLGSYNPSLINVLSNVDAVLNGLKIANVSKFSTFCAQCAWRTS